MEDENGTWSKIWKSSGISKRLPAPAATGSVYRTGNDKFCLMELTQTIVLHSNTEQAKKRAEATLRRSGFDRSDYDLLPTVDVRRLVADEGKGGDETRAEDSKKLKSPARSDWLGLLLSSQALLALQMGKETPYDVDSLDSISEFLSHIAIWKHIVKHQTPYTLVIDGATFDSPYDDVPQRISALLTESDFVRPFPSLHDTVNSNNESTVDAQSSNFAFDVLFLSYKQAFGVGGTHFVVERIPGANNLVRYGADGCMLLETSSYIVSLQGAQKLLDRALPIETRVAPYMFTLGKVDGHFKTLLAQPPIAKQALFQTQHAGSIGDRLKNDPGENARPAITLDDLALMMSRKHLIIGIAVLSFLCLLSIIAAVVMFVRSHRQTKLQTSVKQQPPTSKTKQTSTRPAANRNRSKRQTKK